MTYAVRDTNIDGVEIHKGDIMGLGDQGILTAGKEIEETTFESIQRMVDDDSELISIYYGAEIKEEDAQKLTERLEECYPMLDVELNQGGQPIYYYIISVE